MSGGHRLRLIANVLTVSRYAICCGIAAVGLAGNDLDSYQRLSLIVGLNLIGWTSDMFDGWAARRSGQPSAAWGDADLVADLLLQWTTAYALAWARLVPLYWVNLYLLLVVFTLMVKPAKNVSQITSLPLVLLPAGVSLRYLPALLLLYLGWGVCAAAFFWSRLSNQACEFIDHLPPTPRRWFSGLRAWLGKWA